MRLVDSKLQQLPFAGLNASVVTIDSELWPGWLKLGEYFKAKELPVVTLAHRRWKFRHDSIPDGFEETEGLAQRILEMVREFRAGTLKPLLSSGPIPTNRTGAPWSK